MFSSSFVVLALTFTSMTNFELIWEYCVRQGSRCFLLHLDSQIQFSLYHLLKDSSFLTELSWYPSQKSTDCKYESLVWTLDSIHSSSICIFMTVPHYIDYCSFVIGMTTRLQLFLFHNCFGCVSFDANVTSFMNDINFYLLLWSWRV